MTASLIEAPVAAPTLACTHCGQPVPAGHSGQGLRPGFEAPAGGPAFCCHGCETVYGILHAHGLSGFYRVAAAAEARPNRPQEVDRGYESWDDPRFQARHLRAIAGPEGAGLAELELFLEGVHCGACAWLIERLPRLVPGVRAARLDLAQARCLLRFDPTQVALSRVARQLAGLGYPPHPARAGEVRAARAAEERRHLVRLAVAGFLAANTMLMAFALYSGAGGAADQGLQSLFRLGSLLLAIPAVLGPGALFLRGAYSALRARTLSMDVPIAAALLLGSAWGARNAIRGQGEVFFDTLAVLVFLLLVGRWLERRQRRRAAEESELLQALAPTSARRLEGGTAREVPLEALEPGDRVEVRAGEAIPVDGRVREGESTLDRALLTGESLPVPVAPGDEVQAGVLNLGTPLTVEVERAGEETRVARLLRQVEEAARRKAPLVRLADRLAAWFVAAVLLLSAATLVVWWGTDPDMAVDHAVALLVVTCPCALALATPLAVSVAIGVAARRGVVVRGGDALQRLGAPGRVWLDKTGTLSEGRARLLRWAGDPAAKPLVLALERGAAHPLARGFEAALLPEVGEPPACDAPARRVGQGIEGRVAGRALRVGAPEWLRAGAAQVPPWVEPFLRAALEEAATPVLVEVDGQVVAGAAFGDPLRPEARAAVAWLRDHGHRVGILSGDHPQVVQAIGRQLGLDPTECHGGLTPEDKLARVERSRSEGPVLMVGDGVNDAAALAAASVGVGVRGGAEAVLSTADVFLSRPGLLPLVELLQGAGSTLRTIRRNLALSLVYNAVAAGLALAGLLSPLVAALLMPLSSLTVIGSSTRAWRAPGVDEEVAPWR